MIYCMRATPEAMAAAEKAGVRLIESVKERTKLELSGEHGSPHPALAQLSRRLDGAGPAAPQPIVF